MLLLVSLSSGEFTVHTRDSKGISKLRLIQLILPYKISCIIVSLEIPLLSLTDLEAGCVDHGDVGTQGVAEEVSSAEETLIIVSVSQC